MRILGIELKQILNYSLHRRGNLTMILSSNPVESRHKLRGEGSTLPSHLQILVIYLPPSPLGGSSC